MGNTEEEKRLHRCCFTGHRPEKLSQTEEQIKTKLRIQINKAVYDGYTTFITGMAPGVDIWAAEVVLEMRGPDLPLKLICALPYPEFCKRKDHQFNVHAKRILEQADLVRSICPSFSKESYLIRDRWMVDHSNLVIAVYNGSEGGTAYTINYAKEKEKDIKIIELK